MNSYSHHLKHPVFQKLSIIAQQKNFKIFVIGGFVRDLLLERPSKDIDIVVVGSGIEVAQELSNQIQHTKVHIYKNFGTAMLHIEDESGKWEVEFVGARKESYRSNSRKPIVEDGSLEDDQNRRDFTINALAISLNPDDYGQLYDPFNGIEDLQKKILRTPLDPDITYSDDPLRMMRAIRFASQLGFQIDEKSLEAIKRNAFRIEIVSMERIADEFNKIMMSAKPSTGLKLMNLAGLLSYFLKELTDLQGVETIEQYGHKDNYFHTLQVLDNVALESDNLWLRWAALMHDIGKAPTRRFTEGFGYSFHSHEVVGSKMVTKIFNRLRLPMTEQLRYVQKLVYLHLRPIALVEDKVTDSAVRRLLFEAGEDIDDLMILCHADITSKNQKKVEKYQRNFLRVKRKMAEIEEKDMLRNWQPPISGEDIMDFFKIQPCREVGIIKNAIKDAILDGNLENSRENAFKFMIQLGAEIGLKAKNND